MTSSYRLIFVTLIKTSLLFSPVTVSMTNLTANLVALMVRRSANFHSPS